MNWSHFQTDIFDNLQLTNKHLNISATAGSGKTTTLLECLNRIPSHRSSVFLSFSNTIVNELKERVPSYVEASTLHSLGMRMIGQMFPGAKFKEGKYMDLAMETYKKAEFSKKVFIESFQVSDICGFIRSTLTPLNPESVKEMCNYYDLFWDEKIIQKSIELVEKHSNLKKIKFFDFADMIYLPATRPQFIPKSYDYVFLDEAQDCNAAQMQFVEGLLKVKGRLISVGDKNQAIYAFSGSKIDAFEKFGERPNTITLPLSVSYRCASEIVENAQNVYGDIFPSPIAKRGKVRRGSFVDIKEGDMILCRNNAPLISLYFNLIEREIKASIRGKDIEKGLVKLVESAMSYSEEKFIDKLELKLSKLSNELKAKGVKKVFKHPRYLSLFEKIEIILLILNKVELTLLLPKIKEIFEVSKEGAILMTIHKSKGMEKDRVFYIENYNGDTLIPSKYAVKGWELKQEKNLLFVALTRAKNELVYINLSD